jgi:hypothetical protein
MASFEPRLYILYQVGGLVSSSGLRIGLDKRFSDDGGIRRQPPQFFSFWRKP